MRIVPALALALMAAMLAGVAACSADRELPIPDGAALYRYITEEDNYRAWRMWPGRGELYPGSAPHGAFLTTYVTDAAHSAVQDKTGSIPQGSIIVKENYTADKELSSFTVMYKVMDFNPAENDWFWAKFLPGGGIEAEGRVQGCIDCHGKRRDNDFIYTSPLR